MLPENRLVCLVENIMNANSDINNQIVGIIMDKSTRINTKCIRISEIYL